MTQALTFSLVDREVTFTDEDVQTTEQVLGAIHELQKDQFRNRVQLAYFISLVYHHGLHVIANQDEVGGGSVKRKYRVGSTWARSFELFCRRYCGLGKTSAYQYLNIYDRLVKSHEEFFSPYLVESGYETAVENVPPFRTLRKIAAKSQELEADQTARLLEASTLEPAEFDAEWKEVVEKKDPETASREVEDSTKRAIERIKVENMTVERPQWRSKPFREWIRGLPCSIEGTPSEGQIHPHHIHTVGSGQDDFCNVIPLSFHIHQDFHDLGIKGFAEKWGVDMPELEEMGVKYTVLWLEHIDKRQKILWEGEDER